MKKGQVTIFIIMGVVLLVLTTILIYSKENNIHYYIRENYSAQLEQISEKLNNQTQAINNQSQTIIELKDIVKKQTNIIENQTTAMKDLSKYNKKLSIINFLASVVIGICCSILYYFFKVKPNQKERRYAKLVFYTSLIIALILFLYSILG